MNHELLTPMHQNIGMLQLLENSELNEKQKRFVLVANQSMAKLLKLLNDIIQFSESETTRGHWESMTFNIHTLVKEVIALHSEDADRKGIKIGCIVDNNISNKINGVQVVPQKILNYLIGNAIKFTEKGEVFVGVSLNEQLNDPYELALSVRDTGIGITSAHQEHIFHVFSQVDETITRHYGGTGLGLAICCQLVNSIGGTIVVNSELGQGSEFIVSFNGDLDALKKTLRGANIEDGVTHKSR